MGVSDKAMAGASDCRAVGHIGTPGVGLRDAEQHYHAGVELDKQGKE
jgi:hypothetical protein